MVGRAARRSPGSAPFSKADLKRFGDEPVPSPPILAVRVDDLGEKEAVLAAGHKGFFTIPHFDGYAAVLIELRAVGKRPLRAAIIDGWAACAPGRPGGRAPAGRDVRRR